jgi:hypothetical protein
MLDELLYVRRHTHCLFHYVLMSLGIEKSEIRLLSLLPGRYNEDIRCTLKKVSLDDNPEYEALSYVWGDEHITKFILLDQCGFSATLNLEVALRHLRWEDRPRTLWVDAICVNQENIAERNSQVQLMRSIYEKASRVLVWLGEEADDSGVALDLVSSMKNYDFEKLASEQNYIAKNPVPKEWKALFKLSQRPWWSRVWTVQELAVAKTAVVGCGQKWIPWSDFTNAAFHISMRAWDVGPEYMVVGPNGSPLSHLVVMLEGARSRPTGRIYNTLPELLQATRDRRAKDPRDRVYALLGLVQSEKLRLLKPDYSKSVREVYIETTRWCLETYSNLDVLAIGQATYSETDDSDAFLQLALPSWVPNYTVPCSTGFSRGGYKASGDTLLNLGFTEDSTSLFVQGVFVDTIFIMDTTCMSDEEDMGEGITRIERTLLEAVSKGIPVGSESERQEAFWRTLVANRDVENGKAVAPNFYRMLINILMQRFPVMEEFRPDLPEKDRREIFCRFVVRQIASTMSGRRFFITNKGFMGVGPSNARAGDAVCIIFGACTPYVLRQDGDNHHFIGEAYVHGIMDGEVNEIPSRQYILV